MISSLVIFVCLVFFLPIAEAACGGTVRTFDGGAGNDNWGSSANWSGNNIPDTASEDAHIVAAHRDAQHDVDTTVGCVEIQSGRLTDRSNRTLTVVGDYFRNLTPNSFFNDSNSWFLEMAGLAPQTFENVDVMKNLKISNNTSVTITQPFTLKKSLTFGSGWTGTLYINADLLIDTNADNVTIPSGGTVIIGNGAVVTTFSDWTINGTLKILPGAQLRPDNGEKITIGTTGILILEGAPGNPAVLAGQSSNDTITVNVNGILNAENFQLTRMNSAGLNVSSTGTIQKLDDGDFNYLPNNGYYITLAAGASVPSTINNVNFLNGDSASNPRNFNATNYNGSTITMNNWGGSVGGDAFENDPNNKLTWSTQTATTLALFDYSNPQLGTLGQGSTATIATFAFALNQADTATDITQVKLTMTGTASASDFDHIEVWRDSSSSRNCRFNSGSDVNLTGDVDLTGSPLSYIVEIPVGDVSISSDTDNYCIHVRAQTSSSAQDAKTMQFSIEATGDVVNSEGYEFSASASPPVTSNPPVELNGDPVRKWEGDVSDVFTTNGNWTGGAPDNNEDCEIGPTAGNTPRVSSSQVQCQNATLKTGGILNFNNTNNQLSLTSGLTVQSGFTFSNATSGPGEIAMEGAVSQILSMGSEFPGAFFVANTGSSGNDFVTVVAASLFAGDVTVTDGVLKVLDGATLQVKGDLICQSGGAIEVEGGGTIAMGDGSIIDIQAGCTFSLLGSATKTAVVTSNAGGASYTVSVNGSIAARYYSFDHLGTTGVTISSSATIDSDNHLQNGAFRFPVNNNSTFLSLARQVPTGTLNEMEFALNGSAATGTTNISTIGAASGTLTLDAYTGNLAGLDFDTDPIYLLSWLGATNTIKLTQEAVSPSSVDAGSVHVMGRFGFQQALAGASYVDTDITHLKLTLTGTASANDISEVKVYYDANCDSSDGTLIGSGSLSGNPASVSFDFSASDAMIEADNSIPPKRCLYVEYVFATAAIGGNTAGVKIGSISDLTNSQNYAIDSSTLPPVTLGAGAVIIGSSVTSWIGATSSDWFTASNWSAGVPSATVDCEIDSAGNHPVISGGGGTAVCKSLTIGNGILTLQNGTSAVLELYGSFASTGTFTQNDGTLRLSDDGVTSTNQGIDSNAPLTALTFDKTAGGEVFVNAEALTVQLLTFPSGSDFDFKVPSGKSLLLLNSTTLLGATLKVEAGGSLKMGDATTLTVGAGGVLKMVGALGNHAVMTVEDGSSAYNVVISTGEIEARYYTFDHLGVSGVSVESGATINTTNHLQDGHFTFPVNSSTTMLSLKRKVPTDTLNNMKFDLGGSSCGSSCSSIINIDTTGASSGTLTLNSYFGDVSGANFDKNPSPVYTPIWVGAINTIDLTQDDVLAGSVNAGSTYVMGRFAFKQTQAGLSFSDADLTSLKLTLKGTQDASDIDAVRIYSETDCNSAGGNLIGEGSFSGTPPTVSFTLDAGDARVLKDASLPPKLCLYVEYDIASGAINGHIAGVEISATSHVTNDQGYSIASGTPLPVSLGEGNTVVGATLTTWTGTTSTNWTVASNWSAGVPDSTKNCTIPSAANNPVIASGTTGICKNVQITSGALSLADGSSKLEVYGNYINSGSFTQNGGALKFVDGGAGSNHSITSNTAIESLSFDKTSGGVVSLISSVVPINLMNFPSGSNFEFHVPSGKTLRLPNDVNIDDAVLSVASGGTIEMGTGTTLTVLAGGKLKLVGETANHAKVTWTGAGIGYGVDVQAGATIEARHYTFDHLGALGLKIKSGAIIDNTHHLQDGHFTVPAVTDATTFLTLSQRVPGDVLDGMKFSGGASCTPGACKNINTVGNSTSATLTVTNFTGDTSDEAFEEEGSSYLINWNGSSNTILLTQEATGPSSVNAGSVYKMGRFGFKQKEAGASFVDTDLSSVKVTALGTAIASDIDEVRLYYDADCDSSGGTLIGSGSFAGSPLVKIFSLSPSDATIPASVSSPPLRCLYVEMDIASGASGGNTIGVKINADGDIVNDQNYLVDSSTPTPISLGAPASIVAATLTTWTGTTSTNWTVTSNWSAGVPDVTKTCSIPDVTNDPVIPSSVTAICKNLTITNGFLTLSDASSTLEIHGNYLNNGVLIQNGGTLRIADAGAGVNQTLSSSTTINALTFSKTSGGEVQVMSPSLTIVNLTMPVLQDFSLTIPAGKVLTLLNDLDVVSGVLNIEAGGQLRMASETKLSVKNGAALRMVGTSNAKAMMTWTGSGVGYAVDVESGAEIEARHYSFDHFGTEGIRVRNTSLTSTFNTTNYMQNGEFKEPAVTNGTTFLTIDEQVPGDNLSNMRFDGGSNCSPSPCKNIDTTGNSTNGSLTVDIYTGDTTGDEFENEGGTYAINWTGASNSILLTSESTSSGNMDAGAVYKMGRFGLKQKLAGSSFSDADLSSFKITARGTATASDIDQVRIYYDADCDGTDGNLIGAGVLAGSPLTKTFTIGAGKATIPQNDTSTELRCLYVELEISIGATGGNTVGIEVAAAGHVINDQGYDVDTSVILPVNLGSPRAIVATTTTTWTGATDTDWTTAENWTGGVPNENKTCTIPDVANDPVIASGTTGTCKNVNITSGIVTLATSSSVLEVFGNYGNTGTLNQSSGGDLRFSGEASQTITSSSTITKITFNKSGGDVRVNSTSLTVTHLIMPVGQNFPFVIPTNKTLTLSNDLDVASGIFNIEAGGQLKMASATTLTVKSGGTLKMVGSLGNEAKMTWTGSGVGYAVDIEPGAEIEARYYRFDHLGTSGVRIQNTVSGSTIHSTNHLQNGEFSSPAVTDGTTFLTMDEQVPGDILTNMKFSGGASCSPSSCKNIDTTGNGTFAALSIDTYTGDTAGDSFENEGGAYVINWTGASNTILLTTEAVGPSSVDGGSVYNMGRFGLQQKLAGSSFSDAEITQLRLTATGSAAASDIDEVRIYYDSDCNSSAGTLIGSGTFSGSPLTKTFTLNTGDIVVEADNTTPPLRCIYVEMDIALGATNGSTIGAKIAVDSHITNNQAYGIDSTTSTPVSLGASATIVGATTTHWTGTTSTDWTVANNWSAGVPTSEKTCVIPDVVNDPVIPTATTAQCKNMTISTGVLGFSDGTSVLEVHGNYSNSGTLNQGLGVLRMADASTGLNQTFSSTSQVSALTFNKTGGGEVRLSSAELAIGSLVFPGNSNFELVVSSGTTLTLPNGLSIPAGTFNIESGGSVKIGNGQTVLVNGGVLKISGVNDSNGATSEGQNLSNKGSMAVSDSGTWTFNVSSGSVDLTGFLIKNMDANGLNISGSGSLTNLKGGQFANIASATSKVIQLNTSGLVPATATNIGWMWGEPNKSRSTSCCAPPTTASYYLVYAPNCGGSTITFDQWFGDFTDSVASVNTEDKIFDADDGQNCQVVIAAGASPVTLTKLEAVPYKSAISLDWITGSEVNHAGFNVYRSVHPYSGYIQVNSKLIRNSFNSTNFHGVYRYVDKDVQNGTTYYYKIEDIAYNGATEFHGPVFATPLASLTGVPESDEETNSGDSDSGTDEGNAPTQGPIANPDLIDLGNGVHIIAKTDSSLRLEIIPPPAVWATSIWDASFETLSIPGYSSFLEEGHPELVERTILIEVENHHSTVEATVIKKMELAAEDRQVAPSPSWSPDESGQLQATYFTDATAYSLNDYEPKSYYQVNPKIKSIAGKNYIELKVTPYRYHAVNQQVQGVSQLVIDLTLDGQPAWRGVPPVGGGQVSPATVSGNLRIRYGQSGMYQLTYDEIASVGLDGPFADVDVRDLRLYYHGKEVAFKVDSESGFFNSGDVITFYGSFNVGYEENFDEVILSAVDVLNEGFSPLRMQVLNADSTGVPESVETGTRAYAKDEKDWWDVWDHSLGSFQDRFFWDRIRQWREDSSMNPPAGYPYRDTLTARLDLDGLLTDAPELVTVKVRVSGRSAYSVNLTHHVGIYINNIPFLVAEEAFNENGPRTLVFTVPHSYFSEGENQIHVKVLADMVPPGDMDIVYVDYVEAFYIARRQAVDNIAQITNGDADSKLTIEGFTSSDIHLYDVSYAADPLLLSHISISSPDDGVTQEATFAANWKEDDEGILSGHSFIGVAGGAYLSVSELSLAAGATFSLKDNLAADLIVIGNERLIDAAADLIAQRRSDGLRVVAAPLQQIYDEFSDGLKSSQALRQFLTHARNHWQSPAAKYVLLLGDGTYDSRDLLEMGVSAGTMPIPVEEGTYTDFGNDNWFVTEGESNVPRMAIGRIPTSDPETLRRYVIKLLNYENGVSSPGEESARKSVFIADRSDSNEGFSKGNQALADSLKATSSQFQTKNWSRGDYATDKEAREAVFDSFAEGPLLMTYMGHGAENLWASNQFFTEADAKALKNAKLPIVSALNCLNSVFYTPWLQSMGETLVLNPDGGAIAFLGSTTMTVPPVQQALASGFNNELAGATMKTYHPVRIGDLVLKAKVTIGDTPATVDTLKSFTLFGDPSMKLPANSFAKPAFPGSSREEPRSSERSTPEGASEARESSGSDDGGGGRSGGCGLVKGPPSPPTSPPMLFLLLLPCLFVLSLRRRWV